MVKRSLNWKLLIVTVVVTAAIGGALFAAHTWQVSRTAGIFLTYADKAVQAKEWLKAADYIDRYLAIYPSDAASRVRLAEVFAEGAVTPAQKGQAADLCYRAIREGAMSKESALRLRLADLLLELGRFREAEREAFRLVEAGADYEAPATRVLALALGGPVPDGSLG